MVATTLQRRGSFTTATSLLDIGGLVNALKGTREARSRMQEAKGGTDKVLMTWISTPPATVAPQVKSTNGKNFNWCATCKRWTTTHSIPATHTGGQKANDGNGAAINNNVSFVYDPSVWTTENATAVPSVTCIVFVVKHLFIRLPILWLHICTAIMSLVPIFELAIESFLNIAKFTMASFAAVDWMEVVDQLKVQIVIIWEPLVTFVATHSFSLLVPIFWDILLTLVLLPLARFLLSQKEDCTPLLGKV